MKMETYLPISQSIDESNKDKVLLNLTKEVQILRETVEAIKNNKILEELQLPEEIVKASGIIQKPKNRIGRGRASRPLLESEILDAQSKKNTAFDCTRYLQVSYPTYKKWAKFYGLFKVNPWGKGDKKKYWAPDKGKYPLNQVLEGKFPEYPVFRLKDLLIRSGIKKAECENCGYSERRITDEKMPLILNFEDGNEKNHKLENIKVYCYNCTFCCGKGYIRARRVKRNFADPDIIQGSTRLIESRF